MKNFLKNVEIDLDLTPKGLRGFGKVMFFCLLIIGFILFLKHKPEAGKIFSGAALFFLLASFFTPVILRPMYIAWMCFGFCLGKVNTYILLCVFFYFIITPIGLIARLFGKSFLGIKNLKKDASTYWVKRTSGEIKKDTYERSF